MTERGIVFHIDGESYEMLVTLSWSQAVAWDWWMAACGEWGPS